MDIKPIKNEADYQAAIEEIERLFDAEPDTPEGDELEVLVTLVEAYEDVHYSIPLPDPIEAIKYHMESRGLSPQDLEPYIGSSACVSDILNLRRPLTLKMIQNLARELDISAEILAQPYDCVKEEPQAGMSAGQHMRLTIPISGESVIGQGGTVSYDVGLGKPPVYLLRELEEQRPC